MNVRAEHKGILKFYAFVFLLFGFVLIICGTMFQSEASVLGKHQETAYRQDQVHYWAGIPFLVHGIASVLFVILEVNCVLKFCICLDFICLNIAIFVVIVEGPDWKKYEAKANHYDDSGDVDYKMLKPAYDFGSNSPLTESEYSSAMIYSGVWVFIAICSILLAVETFLMHVKVYCGIENIYAYTSGYEIIRPEISLKTAKPIEKFECKGCKTNTPTVPPQTLSLKPTATPVPRLPTPNVVPNALQGFSVPDGASVRSVSPTPSDASNISNAFYVCQEGEGIKLVGYKPRRKHPRAPQLCTHHEEEEGAPDHYHFSKKHPGLYESPTNSPNTNEPLVAPNFPKEPQQSPNIPRSLPLTPNNPKAPPRSPITPQSHRNSPLFPAKLPPLNLQGLGSPARTPNDPRSPSFSPIAKENLRKEPNLYDPDLSPSVPRRLPSSLLVPREGKNRGGAKVPRGSPTGAMYAENRRISDVQSPLVTSFIPIAPAPPPATPPAPPQDLDGKAELRTPEGDRSPGKYPPTADIFPPPPSTLPTTRQGRPDGRRVSFVDLSSEPGTPVAAPNNPQKFDTLI